MKVRIKRYHAVAIWKWDVDEEVMSEFEASKNGAIDGIYELGVWYL
jgi:hypothetical protein